MTDRLVYLIGAPGSGKSTLMSRLTFPRYDRHAIAVAPDYPVAHDVLTTKPDGLVVGAELGVQRGAFSGTDALPSSIVDKADPWIRTNPYPLVLGEGARLANKRFLTAAQEGGYEVTLVFLEHADTDDWRALRSERLGKVQNPSWVKGQTTASANLAEWFSSRGQVISGHPDDVVDALGALDSRLAGGVASSHDRHP